MHLTQSINCAQIEICDIIESINIKDQDVQILSEFNNLNLNVLNILKTKNIKWAEKYFKYISFCAFGK